MITRSARASTYALKCQNVGQKGLDTLVHRVHRLLVAGDIPKIRQIAAVGGSRVYRARLDRPLKQRVLYEQSIVEAGRKIGEKKLGGVTLATVNRTVAPLRRPNAALRPRGHLSRGRAADRRR